MTDIKVKFLSYKQQKSALANLSKKGCDQSAGWPDP